MKKLTALLLLAFALSANVVNAQKEHKAYHENGNLKEEGQYDSNGNGIGDWKFYHESGILKRTGSFKEGNPDGEFKFYNKMGWLIDIHNYKSGEKVGLEKGCYFGNCENGYGKKFLGWGTRQEGNFTNGKLNGEGIEINTLSGIKIYEGNFIDGEKEGIGTETKQQGFKYVGLWKSGKKNGEGILTSYNTFIGDVIMDKYIGNWLDDEKSGAATMIEYGPLGKTEERKLVGNWTWNDDNPSGIGKEYINGELVYEGTFKNGSPFKTVGCIAGDCENGQGVFVSPEHVKYIGGFENGKKNGFGFELNPKAGMYVLVNWKDDKEDGYARVYNINNELVFAVEMKDGKLVNEFSENGVEVGCVKGDCQNGFGHYVWDDGMTYTGEFKNGVINGSGTLAWSEGKYIGSFKEAKRYGYGREYNSENVLVKQGPWINDLFYLNLSIEKEYSKDEKCTLGNCIDGFGIFIETFEPGWNDAYRDYVNTYEIKYEGFWKDGKYQGLGYATDRMNKSVIGEFEDGELLK